MEEIIQTLTFILVPPFMWFGTFIWHELMHAFEVWRQTRQVSSIIVRFSPIPSAYCSYWNLGAINEGLVSLAGGLYTGILCLSLMWIAQDGWQFSLMWCGIVQTSYGLFEYKFSDTLSETWFKIARYTLYIGLTILSIVLWTLLH
jgi:hypothetical protein